MKIASLALATALAAMVGSAQPTLAQPYDKSGGSDEKQSQDAPRMHQRMHQQQQDQSSDHDRDWQSRPGRHHRSRAEGGPMGQMHGWGRRGMGRCGGVQFHFARGNERIDIQCPADQNMESCVRAASQLIDKVMNSANKSDARFDGANGSGSQGGDKMHAPVTNDGDTKPNTPRDRM
jgi:hypothetical protein